MKKLVTAFFGICLLLSLQNCNRHLYKDDVPVFTDLPDTDSRYQYIKNYFMLSEQRKIDKWYSTYLAKCTLFYKIENPTKDTIIALIKSYWVTSDGQKHDIQSIQWRSFKKGAEVLIIMNYAYRIIAEDRVKQIPKLKLQMILNRQNKVISIREMSRG